MAMTNDEYLTKGGNNCPKCNSENLSGDDFSTDSGYALQDVSCDDCGVEWKEFYHLAGYDSLKRGSE